MTDQKVGDKIREIVYYIKPCRKCLNNYKSDNKCFNEKPSTECPKWKRFYKRGKIV